MWAKLLIYLEAFFVIFLELCEGWFVVLASVSGIVGAVFAGTLFVLSSGYFFPELREKSKPLFLAAGLFSLIGGSLLFNQLGQAIGLFPSWDQGTSIESVSAASGDVAAPPIDAGSTTSTGTLFPSSTDGSLSSDGAATTDPSVSLPDTSSQPEVAPSYPSYVVLAASDGSWPALWSDVSSSAYTITTVPAGAEVQLTSDCVTDVSGNYWCPITYESQSGWIASGSLVAK